MAKIAVASSDGLTVNEHFGHANFLRIYEIDGTESRFIEIRDVVAACQHSFGHDETKFERIVSLISDCDALFVKKIGPGAAEYLISRNVRVFEVNAGIDALLNKIIQDKLI